MMTDGRSYDNVYSPALLFRRRNIKCYAVGIGRKYNRRQLLQIAAGDRRHVITAGFRQLGSIVGTIQRRACRGTLLFYKNVNFRTFALLSEIKQKTEQETYSVQFFERLINLKYTEYFRSFIFPVNGRCCVFPFRCTPC